MRPKRKQNRPFPFPFCFLTVSSHDRKAKIPTAQLVESLYCRCPGTD